MDTTFITIIFWLGIAIGVAATLLIIYYPMIFMMVMAVLILLINPLFRKEQVQ